MSKETGGWVYPSQQINKTNQNDALWEGISLREWLAAKALPSILNHPWYLELDVPFDEMAKIVARDCFVMADAMIKERDHE